MNEEDSGRPSVRLDNLLVLSTEELTNEQKRRRIDLLSTILLSLSAVLSALSAYQASRWYSEMNISLSESTTMRAQAAVADRDANRYILGDMMLFVEWTQAYRQKDSLMMIAVEDRFSETLEKAFGAWRQLPEKGAAGLLPKDTPFKMVEYSLPLQEQSKALVKKSEEKFERAKSAARIGDDFIFSLVIFSLSLFFGAVCTKFEQHRLQVYLFWTGAVAVLAGLIVIVQLPWNIGF